MKEQGKSASASTGTPRVRSVRWVFYVGAVMIILVVAGAILLGKGKWFAGTRVETHSAHDHADHNSNPRAAADSSLVSRNRTPPPGPAPDGMVWIPGGTFWIGCEN